MIALDQSRTKTVDSANSILVEARLRAEVSTMMTQRDEAIGHAEENKHKVTLLQEQLHNQKIKLSRVTQEKIKMERDFMASQRASKSLVRSLESQSSSLNDNEYYNRKITELHGRVQSMQVVVTEKNRQIDDMRHKLDRWTSMGADNRNERKRLL